MGGFPKDFFTDHETLHSGVAGVGMIWRLIFN